MGFKKWFKLILRALSPPVGHSESQEAQEASNSNKQCGMTMRSSSRLRRAYDEGETSSKTRKKKKESHTVWAKADAQTHAPDLVSAEQSAGGICKTNLRTKPRSAGAVISPVPAPGINRVRGKTNWTLANITFIDRDGAGVAEIRGRLSSKYLTFGKALSGEDGQRDRESSKSKR